MIALNPHVISSLSMKNMKNMKNMIHRVFAVPSSLLFNLSQFLPFDQK